jgi:indole-3-glycerol phosphate synthase
LALKIYYSEAGEMNILENIINHKREEVKEKKELYPLKLLEKSIYFDTGTVSLKEYLKRADKVGVIAEIKRKSPSKGEINKYISVERTSIGYMQAGASALSVLTDTKFFGGKNEDLTTARVFNYCPILRKDFIVDQYQVVETRSIGADVVLLIAAVLEPAEISDLAKFAKSLGLEVLLEVKDKTELDRSLNEYIDIVGINNRNLNDFSVNISGSESLVTHIPKEFMKISESGINSAAELINLKTMGFDGFLIGERFMKHSRPEKACADFIKDVRTGLGT